MQRPPPPPAPCRHRPAAPPASTSDTAACVSESGHQNHASAAAVATVAPATIATPARRVRHMNSATLAVTHAKAARDDAAAHARTSAAADVPAAGVRQPHASVVRTTKRTPTAKRSEPVTDNSQNPIEASGSTSASAVPASPPPARRTVQTSTASASGVRSAYVPRDRQRRDERRPCRPDAGCVAEIGRDVQRPLSGHQSLRRRDERIVLVRAPALRLQPVDARVHGKRSARRPRTGRR